MVNSMCLQICCVCRSSESKAPDSMFVSWQKWCEAVQLNKNVSENQNALDFEYCYSYLAQISTLISVVLMVTKAGGFIVTSNLGKTYSSTENRVSADLLPLLTFIRHLPSSGSSESLKLKSPKPTTERTNDRYRKVAYCIKAIGNLQQAKIESKSFNFK